MFAYPSRTTLSNRRGHRSSKEYKSSVTTIAAATATVLILWLYPVARNYGLGGLLRYLKDGDPQPLHVRKGKQTLKLIATQLEDKEKTLNEMEDILKRPSLYSLNGAVLLISHRGWERNVPDRDALRKSLSLLSHELDQLAGQIDQVSSTIETKGLKKELSNRVVRMMARTDVLISMYKHS